MDANKTADRDKIEKVVDLLKRAMAGRSCRQYAQGAGISPAGLNKILNKKNLPTPATIKKLMSKEADPQGGVTLEDVMVAAGYLEATDEEKIEEAAKDKIDFIIEKDPQFVQKTIDRISFRNAKGIEIHENRLRYEQYMKGVIVSALIQNDIFFSYTSNTGEERYRHFYDLALNIDSDKARIKEWFFTYRYMWPERPMPMMRLYDSFGSLLFRATKPWRKVSFVINDKRTFEKLRVHERSMPYRGELSLIYLNEEDSNVYEVYLANYMDGVTDQEIYLPDLINNTWKG